jgi:hypothetical protein
MLSRIAPATSKRTTTHGCAFQTVHSRNPPIANAKSRAVRTPLVQIGLERASPRIPTTAAFALHMAA